MFIRIAFLLCVLALLLAGTVGAVRQGRGIPGMTHILILAWLGALGGVAAVLVATHLYPPVMDDPATPILRALALALPFSILLAFLNVPIQRLKNPFGTINPIQPLAVLALSLAGAAMAMTGWDCISNGWLDTSPSTTYRAVLEYDKSGKPVATLEDGRKIPLPNMIDAEVGDSLEVQLRLGYQDREWINGYAKHPRNK